MEAPHSESSGPYNLIFIIKMLPKMIFTGNSWFAALRKVYGTW